MSFDLSNSAIVIDPLVIVLEIELNILLWEHDNFMKLHLIPLDMVKGIDLSEGVVGSNIAPLYKFFMIIWMNFLFLHIYFNYYDHKVKTGSKQS